MNKPDEHHSLQGKRNVKTGKRRRLQRSRASHADVTVV